MAGLALSLVDMLGAFCGVPMASEAVVISGYGPLRVTLKTTRDLSGGRLISVPIENGRSDGKAGI
jgi:hypothetical protein